MKPYFKALDTRFLALYNALIMLNMSVEEKDSRAVKIMRAEVKKLEEEAKHTAKIAHLTDLDYLEIRQVLDADVERNYVKLSEAVRRLEKWRP